MTDPCMYFSRSKDDEIVIWVDGSLTVGPPQVAKDEGKKLVGCKLEIDKLEQSVGAEKKRQVILVELNTVLKRPEHFGKQGPI